MKPIDKLTELLKECGSQVTVSGWKAELIAVEKERDALRVENKELMEEFLAEHQAAVDMFSKYDLVKDENAKLRADLEHILFRLERNAKGEQSYGGFHTVLDEFASIESLVIAALNRPYDQVKGVK